MKLKMLLPLAALSSVLLLQGCVPVALVAGATAGGAVIYDNRSFKQMNIDNRITQQCTVAINSNEALKTESHISIATYNGIVLLVGQAPTAELRQKAYDLIKNIPDIVRIYNEITISGPTTAMQRTSDTWITAKVKSSMLAQSGLHSTNIKVVTEDGVVYLMGNVSRKQADLAASVARRVSGVQKVVKVFQYPH